MNIIIIKYNAGNIMSVDYALQRLGVKPEVTDDHDLIRAADKVIFPGVGEASTTMRYLKENKLDQLIPDLKQPVLGICLGLQLMCLHTEEGDTACLGIFDETVRKFNPSNGNTGKLKVPHMGWNTIYNLKSDLFPGIREYDYVYFVHSYYASTGPHTIARCDYPEGFSAALHRDNFYATQFHPEKSGKTGEQILKNFLEL
jgi:imidazole glycerol-phosphate synthase subunit HisH